MTRSPHWDEQTSNLPRQPYLWSPSQLASYLDKELHEALDSDTIRIMTGFIQDLQISGKVFLSLDEEDFQDRRLDELHPFWCNAMWDAVYSTLPYKRSRTSNFFMKPGKVRSIMDVFESIPDGTGDTSKVEPSVKPMAFRKPFFSHTSAVKPEWEHGGNQMKIQSPTRADISTPVIQANSGSLENQLPLSPESHPERYSIKQFDITFVPKLVPVLLPSSATPTDVILLNEGPAILLDSTTSSQRRSFSQHPVSPFPVFQEPEDAPDEDPIIMTISTPHEKNESLLSELCFQASGEPGLGPASPGVTEVDAEGQPSLQDFASQLLTVANSKDVASSFDYTTASASHGAFTFVKEHELHQEITDWEPLLIKPRTDTKKQTSHDIEIPQIRSVELENWPKTMEKGTHQQAYIGEQKIHWHLMTNFDNDGETEYDSHLLSSNKNHSARVKIALKKATDKQVTRPWQNTLILLAGATAGLSVALLPGFLRHIWNKW